MRYIANVDNWPYPLDEKRKQRSPCTSDEATRSWHRLGGENRRRISRALLVQQQNLCAYCEINLDSEHSTHIEHVRPKSEYPKQTFDYNNLVCSCFSSDALEGVDRSSVSCGHNKGEKWFDEELFVKPSELLAASLYSCSFSGELEPSRVLGEGDERRALYTCDALNLNCKRLKRLRETVLLEGAKALLQIRNDVDEEHQQDAINYFVDLEMATINGKKSAFHSIRIEHFLFEASAEVQGKYLG